MQPQFVEVPGGHPGAFAIQQVLAGRWATAPAGRTTREPGKPGVLLSCFLDLRQEPDA